MRSSGACLGLVVLIVACGGEREIEVSRASTASLALNPTPTLNEFAMLAEESLVLESQARVLGGDSGVRSLGGSGFKLIVRAQSIADPTRTVHAQSVRLESQAHVGDVQTFNLSVASGATHGPVGPFLPLPAFPSLGASAPGTQDVTVTANGSRTLAPGSYRDVKVNARGRLELTGGTYNIRSLSIESQGRVLTLAASRIVAATSVSVKSQSQLVPRAGLTASAMAVDIHGSGTAFTAEASSLVQALVLAPNGSVRLQSQAQAKGAFLGRSITAAAQATVTFEDGFAPINGECIPSDCNDANPCTADSCSSGSCVHTPVAAGTSCTDGDECNGAEACNASGSCTAGPPPIVDDGNPCTTDACAASGGVTHTPVAVGTSCSDGDACNGAETCNAIGSCTAGTPPVVDDGNPCTADACTASGGVTHTPVPVGTSCADGDTCNGAETCNASGSCTAGAPPVVDDGNPCTADACTASGGVTHTPVVVGTSCSDGDACNGAETCNASGSCTAGTPPVVDDGNPCTADACSPSSGVTHTPVAMGTSCADGDACNGAETCNASGACTAGTPPIVDDGNPCTADACTASGGVTHTPVAAGTSCSDADACNGAETCNPSGTCTAGTPPVVDDGNPCTADACTASGGVTHTPVAAGTSCSDADACNGAETCNPSGTCTAGTPPVVDDGNPCTADACTASGGVTHTPVAAGTSCSDGDACNGAETCNASGTCSAGTPPAVDDGNPCTADACTASGGVTHTPVGAGTSCSDGDACNGAETCNASGACTAGTPPVVDDGNLCTADACTPSGGVTHTPVGAGTSCSDGDACNGAETCNASGTCSAGTPPVVDDGNPCTADACTASGGVTHTPVAAGTSCSDADPCNGAETCIASGTCAPGTPPVVDDGNSCTADACTASGGVTHTPVAAGTSCSDGDACNGAETCNASGTCSEGTPPVVDDGNPCTADACTASGGVTHTPVAAGTSCSDGDACNGAETCNASGACTAGTPPVVDDGNPCTADVCTASGGVTHTPVDAGTSCSDGDACNGAETCNASGACTAGTLPVVDDGNPCTADACTASGGVTHTPVAAGTSCSDGDACNGAETCNASGTCAAGTPPVIDDGNPCTADACAASGGVTHTPVAAGTSCSDGDACNGLEMCNASGICTAGTPPVIDDGNLCTADACTGGVVTHTPIVDCVPDPVLIAPPLDRTRTTPFDESVSFLWLANPPVQRNVNPAVFDPKRVSVLRGRVLDGSGQPLSGVIVRAPHEPEFGDTRTRADGQYDFAFNGGSRFVLTFERAGYLPAERWYQSGWNRYASLGDVTLIALDAQATPVTFGSAGDQLAQGSQVTDGDGTRAGTVMIPAATQASAVLADGTRVPLPSGTVRITEFTVGQRGLNAMPAPLPAGSAYTYCTEVTLDEATALGAARVEFDRPVSYYFENFLGVPVGMGVPVGTYERESSRWYGEIDALAIKLLSNAPPTLDVTGDDLADDQATLDVIGVDAGELSQIATRFAPNTVFMRARLSHFTPVDVNMRLVLLEPTDPEPPPSGPPGGPPPPPPPPGPPPPDGDPDPDPNDEECGSRIACQSQVLGERIPLVGVPTDLFYSSDRAPGYRARNRINIPVESLRNSASDQIVTVTIAGVVHDIDAAFYNVGRQVVHFDWDGLDRFGRPTQGASRALVDVKTLPPYAWVPVEEAVALSIELPASWGSVKPATTSIGARAAGRTGGFVSEGGLPFAQRSHEVVIGRWDAGPAKIGYWELGVHHQYVADAGTLFRGDGTRVNVESIGAVTETSWQRPQDDITTPFPAYTAILPDGSIYFASFFGFAVAKLSRDGTVAIVAGDPNTSGLVDGPGANARFNFIRGLALDEYNNLYIADSGNNRIRMLRPDGVVSTLYGDGPPNPSAQPIDDADAKTVSLGALASLARRPDGSFVFYEENSSMLWEITAAGRTRSLSLQTGNYGAEGPINELALAGVLASSATRDGDVLLCEAGMGLIRRLNRDGILSTIAGGGTVLGQAEDIPARDAAFIFNNCSAPRQGDDGSVYFTINSESVVYQVSADLRLRRAYGRFLSGSIGAAPKGTPALTAEHVATIVDLAPDGSLRVANNDAFMRIARLDRFSADTAAIIPSEDGAEYYTFDAFGRHLDTRDALTNVVIYHFDYTADGLLSRVTDRNNLETSIERNGDGYATAIVGPYGERTTLSIDAAGDLRDVTSPAAEIFALGYDANHLLTSLQDPRGGLHSYQYDSLGRLERDQSPGLPSKTLTRVSTPLQAHEIVELTTQEGRTKRYETLSETIGSLAKRTRTNTDQDGTIETTVINNGTTTVTSADGTVTTMVEIPDPRFGSRASTESVRERLPSGLERVTSSRRSATLADPTDITSVVTLTEVSSFGGADATSIFTAASRRFDNTSYAGRSRAMTVDAFGRPSAIETPSILPTMFTYDGFGRLETVTQGSRATSYTYDSAGRLRTVTDPALRTVTYGRDLAGRITSITRPDTTQILMTRDAHGNVTSVTPPGRPAHVSSFSSTDLETLYTPPAVPGGGATQFIYDADDLLTAVQRPDGVTLELNREPSGRIGSIVDAFGSRVRTYNAAGQLQSASDPSGQVVSFSYDGGLVTSTTFAGEVNGTVTREYDSRFFTSRLFVNGDPIDYTIDNDGFVTQAGPMSIARDATNGLLQSTSLGAVETSYSHNDFGERLSKSTVANGSPVYQESYTRDDLGRILARTVTVSAGTKVFAYNYDVLGRLYELLENGSIVEQYGYDSNGNRTSSTVRGQSRSATYDAQDRLIGLGDTSYAYNAAGELTSKTTPLGTTTYGYDALGNLRHVDLPDGRAIDYVIDGLNRRVGKKIDGVLVQRFLYEGPRVVAELDAGGNVVAEFVYGAETTPAYVIRGAATYEFIADQVGSPMMLVDSASGTIVQRTEYDSFGVVVLEDGAILHPFGFAGGMRDAETGLVRLGARDYDPEIGRWLLPDSARFGGSPWNLYGYAMNDPINITDSNGKKCRSTVNQKPTRFHPKKPKGQKNIGNTRGSLKKAKPAAKCAKRSDGYGFDADVSLDITVDIWGDPNALTNDADGNTVAAHEDLHAQDLQDAFSGQLLDEAIPTEGFDSLNACEAANNDFADDVNAYLKKVAKKSHDLRDR